MEEIVSLKEGREGKDQEGEGEWGRNRRTQGDREKKGEEEREGNGRKEKWKTLIRTQNRKEGK